MFGIKKNMNLCDVILLNFLALIRDFVSINVGEEVATNFDSIKANNMNLGNISRVKRSGAILSLCSDIKSKKMPCAINGKYELQEIIAKGGCGTVLKGKEVSSSRFENWCQISKRLFAVK